jgi:hypothetical protein
MQRQATRLGRPHSLVARHRGVCVAADRAPAADC